VSERTVASAGAPAPDWEVVLRAARRGTEVDTAAKLSADTGRPQPLTTPNDRRRSCDRRVGLAVGRGG